MSSFDDVDSELNELLPEPPDAGEDTEADTLEGKFQTLSSLGGCLGIYKDLTNPTKGDLLTALSDLGVQTAAKNSVYDFVRVDGDTTKGFIQSKDGSWIEQDIGEYPDREISGNYTQYTRLASFLGLYERYGLDNPSASKLRRALINYGVRDAPEGENRYLAPLETGDGTEQLIGIETGKVTVGYPVDSAGYRVGDEEYTRDLLPKLAERLGTDGDEIESRGSHDQFVPSLPDDVENLLENEQVAENYQLIMHRLAEQATGEDVPAAVRSQKLAEARFITEVLTGERTWE